ncbi:sugar phosphate isomerase/epimerase family protein [Halorhabdus rudnickae]|uniref:sugar phosphate isomerase/epimerase family protein n=1 Tax=Halorhabdus rudnickae TaxID=1775544 RepID=UPI001082880C|nr:sugar phosphate isomerase/epimerase family protein [Halorhabdus rudnickae]
MLCPGVSVLVFWNLDPAPIGVERSFPEAATLAATHGFDGIQVDLGYLRDHGRSDYRAVLDKHDLRSGALALPFDIDAERPDYEAGLDRLEADADAAAAIGCECVSTYIRSFSDDRPFEENLAFHRERIEPIAEILAEHDLALGLEYLGPPTLREGHEYEFVHTADGMGSLIDGLEASNVGFLLDSWHWYTAGDGADALQALDPGAVVDVHVNDAPDRPRDAQQDLDRRLPAETGVIDIETFLVALDRLDYDGPVTPEPFSDRVDAMDDDAAVAATSEALSAAFDRAGL